MVSLLTAGYFSDPAEWTTILKEWWDGDYGLYFMGSWITGMVDDPSDLGVFSLPGCEGLVFAADYFFIPTYTEHLEEAKELFQFLASEEAQSIQVAQGGHIATNIHVPLDAYPEVDRRVAEIFVGKELLPDLDDTIGGVFQLTFWDQLKLLWVSPRQLDNVLEAMQAVAPGPPPPPEYTLTIHSSPTGVTFVVDGVPRTTPWSGTYSEGASVSLVMPETHDGYIWSHWLEDEDPNRSKSVAMNKTYISLTGTFFHIADLNHDGAIDMKDLSLAAKAFGSYLGHPRWNSIADINQDNKIDIRDLVTVARNFGKTA